MFGLLLDQWSIQFQQSRCAGGTGVFHARKTPKRVALIDEGKWTFGFQRGVQRLICSEALLFAESQVALGGNHERVQVNYGKIRWWNAGAIGSEQINLRATFDHRAQHFLHMDRTTLAAK